MLVSVSEPSSSLSFSFPFAFSFCFFSFVLSFSFSVAFSFFLLLLFVVSFSFSFVAWVVGLMPLGVWVSFCCFCLLPSFSFFGGNSGTGIFLLLLVVVVAVAIFGLVCSFFISVLLLLLFVLFRRWLIFCREFVTLLRRIETSAVNSSYFSGPVAMLMNFVAFRSRFALVSRMLSIFRLLMFAPSRYSSISLYSKNFSGIGTRFLGFFLSFFTNLVVFAVCSVSFSSFFFLRFESSSPESGAARLSDCRASFAFCCSLVFGVFFELVDLVVAVAFFEFFAFFAFASFARRAARAFAVCDVRGFADLEVGVEFRRRDLEALGGEGETEEGGAGGGEETMGGEVEEREVMRSWRVESIVRTVWPSGMAGTS